LEFLASEFTVLKQKTMSASKTLRKLEVVSPVPADIDIANSVEPFHISEIAKELNLSPKHYDLYGKYKAKVSSFFIFLWWDLCNIMKWLFSCFLLIVYVDLFDWCRCFSCFLLIVYVDHLDWCRCFSFETMVSMD